jgi:amidase
MDAARFRASDALACAEQVATGETTPARLLELACEEVRAGNPDLGAVVHLFATLAGDQIDAGRVDGPFRGVPLLVKDASLHIAGTPLTSGSRLFEGQVCSGDDTLTERLKAAGLVPFGRTTTPELSLSFTSEPAAFGPARNPWAPSRSAGGSSGGAAAAVAAGIVPIAHATDGAGSIRVPAAHCGVFGFKPSRIRNPLGPRIAEGNGGMATPHAITRSVRDSAALLDATSGGDIGDPYAVEAPKRSFREEASIDPRPLRIGLWDGRNLAVDIDGECRSALLNAADLCASLGHMVEEADPDHDDQRLRKAWRYIASVGAADATREALLRRSRDLVEPINLEWIDEGLRCPATDYLAAMNKLHAAGRALGRFFTRFDILLSPVTSTVAPPLGTLSGAGHSIDGFFSRFWDHAPFTAVFNASGCPAMSVPLYWIAPMPDAPSGLPVGVQFGAARGDDGLLFALAGQLERARPWLARRPPYPFPTSNGGSHGDRI